MLRIYIVEDEEIIAEALAQMVQDLGYKHVGTSHNYADARRALSELKEKKELPDLYLLDITLGEHKDGLMIGEELHSQYQIPFIYITAHTDKDTIQKATSLGAIGYLVKPIMDSQVIYATIEVAMSNQTLKAQEPTANAEEEEEHKEATAGLVNESLFVKDDYYFTKVNIQDIQYMQSFRNYLEVATAKKKYIVRSTLKDFLGKLPESQFMQVHRSYAINLKFMEALKPTAALVGKEEIPVSKTYREALNAKVRLLS